VSEPVTAITDWALAAVGIYWARRAWRAWPACGAALGMLALGALLGGTWHAMRDALPPPAAALLWRATAWALGGTGFLLVYGSAQRLLRGTARAIVVAAAALELAAYLAWTATNADFVWTGLYVGTTMIAVLVLHALEDPRPHILAGAVTALVAGVVQQSDLRLGTHVGPNDLYHLVAMLAVVLLGMGAERGRARASKAR
jgi:hypothetical protein